MTRARILLHQAVTPCTLYNERFSDKQKTLFSHFLPICKPFLKTPFFRSRVYVCPQILENYFFFEKLNYLTPHMTIYGPKWTGSGSEVECEGSTILSSPRETAPRIGLFVDVCTYVVTHRCSYRGLTNVGGWYLYETVLDPIWTYDRLIFGLAASCVQGF